MKLVKFIKLNNLQYNPNRDPEVYRRPINEEFRVQASLSSSGSARCSFSVEGETLCEGSVSLPGTFDCKFSFDTAGSRMGDLMIEANGETYHQKIRIDVLEHAWIG
ncbi:MAG: hypothetical protein ACQETK_09370 [Pseudomonadota bacterium]